VDTSDTADTGSTYEDSGEIISAAELAGETGGFSCSTIASSNFTLTLAIVLFVLIKGIRK